MYYDKSCCVPKQIFLQSVVLWCLLLLGNMALFGGEWDFFAVIVLKNSNHWRPVFAEHKVGNGWLTVL